MWTRGESNPRLIHAMDVCYRYTTGPWCPRQESNLDLRFRKPPFYPLNYEGELLKYPIRNFYSGRGRAIIKNMFNQSPNPVVEAIKRIKDSVVSIVVSKEIPPELLESLPIVGPGGLPFPTPPESENDKFPHDHDKIQIGGGSGFIVTADGLILTNKHVVSDAEATYSVVLDNDLVLPAKILSRDPINDIAIIKIEAKKELPVAPLGSSSKLELGETLIAIGNALGTFKNTVSVGVVSGLSRFLSAHDGMSGAVAHLRGLIQTDAAINPGNSGGPLVNVRGEAVGINVATVMGAENIGFAIPINSAKRDLEDLKKFGHIRKPFFGVRYVILNKELKSQFRLSVENGAYVIKEDPPAGRAGIPGDDAVVPGSPAEKAGIKEKDIIIELKGRPITEKTTLQDVLENCEVGEKVPLTYLRGGKEAKTEVVLEERK